MTNSTKLAIEVPLPNEYPQEQRQYELQLARHQLTKRLLEQIHNGRWYAIRITEEWPQEYIYREYTTPSWLDMPRFRMYIDVNEIESRHVEFPIVRYEEMDWGVLTKTAWGEIRRRFRECFKRIREQ